MAELNAINENMKDKIEKDIEVTTSAVLDVGIEDRVKKIISNQFKKDINQLDSSATFSDLGADSLDTVEVIMAVEDEFNINISDDEAQKMQNLGDIVKYIQNKIENN